jgi:hypothetical protein
MCRAGKIGSGTAAKATRLGALADCAGALPAPRPSRLAGLDRLVGTSETDNLASVAIRVEGSRARARRPWPPVADPELR